MNSHNQLFVDTSLPTEFSHSAFRPHFFARQIFTFTSRTLLCVRSQLGPRFRPDEFSQPLLTNFHSLSIFLLMRGSGAALARSVWRGPFLPFTLPKDPASIVRTDARATTIIPAFVGRKFEIHNGQRYVSVSITEEMINRKLGEFALTKKPVVYKKKDAKGR